MNKNLRGYYSLFSLLFIFIVDLFLLFSTHSGWNDSMKKYLPLQKEVAALKADVAEAHLWLEEAIAGDPYVDIEEDVMIPLEYKSFKLYYANAHDIFDDDCECLEGLRKLSIRLKKFEQMAKKRWELSNKLGAGSEFDQEFDRQYQAIMNIADTITYEIDHKISQEIESRNQTFIFVLSFFLLMNAMIFIILFIGKKRESAMSNLLARKAHYDTLTDLPNRELYLDRLDQAIKVSKRENVHLAVVFLDLDGFKNINDTKGHDNGDKVLQEFGTRLRNNVRSADTVSRFGGDEFTLLLHAVKDESDIVNVMEKIMKAARLPFVIDNEAFYMTLSVGIAVYREDGKTDDELLKNADIAMYHSKKQGKDRYTFYSSLVDNEA